MVQKQQWVYRVQVTQTNYVQVDVKSDEELSRHDVVVAALRQAEQEFGRNDEVEAEQVELIQVGGFITKAA